MEEDVAGRYFFHYTTREAAFERILPSGRLRFSPYERMRDPLENKRWRFRGTEREARPTEGAEFRRLADTIRSSAKLLSFTVDALEARGRADWFDLGWARPRMWEQYAENHTGVCLVFERAKLTKRIETSLRAQNLALPYYHPVSYTPEGIGGATLDLRMDEVTGASVARYVQDHHHELFFLKAADWATEFEYRFVVTTPDFEFVSAEYGDALDAVIAGEGFPNWQRPAAVHSCRHASADALVLDWSTGRPLLMSLP